MNGSLLEMIRNESRSPTGFAPVLVKQIWADIGLIRRWSKADDLPLTHREFRKQLDALARARPPLVVLEGEGEEETVRACVGVEEREEAQLSLFGDAG